MSSDELPKCSECEGRVEEWSFRYRCMECGANMGDTEWIAKLMGEWDEEE